MLRLDGPDREDHWSRIALAACGDAIIVTDAAGNIVLCNAAAEALTGWGRADCVGRSLGVVFRIVDEETRIPNPDPVVKAITAGRAVGLARHTVLIARDGTEWPLDDSAAPIREDGAVVGVVLVFRDAVARRQAERASDDALAFAEGIVGAIRDPLLILDAGLCVRSANQSFYRTFGGEPAGTEGRPLFRLGGKAWDIPRLGELLSGVAARDEAFEGFEADVNFGTGGPRHLRFDARRLSIRGASAGLVLLAVEDVTQRQRTTRALAASEVRYRRLFETAQDGILLLDPDTRHVFDVNPFLTDMLGYDAEELVGRELWELGFFRDAESNREAFRRLLDEGYIRYEDLPLRTKDDRQIDVEFVSNVYEVDDGRVIQCNIRDVTDRKRAEAALQAAHDHLEERVDQRTAELIGANEALSAEIARRESAEADRQGLLLRLAAAQEDERRRIARELHDQMGQHLTALSLGLKVIQNAEAGSVAFLGQLRQLQDLTDRIGREVHHLALELRPTALDDLGLHAALVNYTDGWAEGTGVELDAHLNGPAPARLLPEVETALYRVVQEALTNVLKHAGARRVSLVLRQSAGQVQVVVEDDGRGFEPEAVAEGRLGLLGMRERLSLVGGTLTVESAAGQGCTIIARVPLAAAGGADA